MFCLVVMASGWNDFVLSDELTAGSDTLTRNVNNVGVRRRTKEMCLRGFLSCCNP